MAIQLINGQSLKIAGSDTLEITEPVILCDEPTVRVVGQSNVKLICPYMVYESFEKWESARSMNSIKTELLYKKSIEARYDRSKDGDQYEFIDRKMKADLAETYGIPEDNISFVPPHEEL